MYTLASNVHPPTPLPFSLSPFPFSFPSPRNVHIKGPMYTFFCTLLSKKYLATIIQIWAISRVFENFNSMTMWVL